MTVPEGLGSDVRSLVQIADDRHHQRHAVALPERVPCCCRMGTGNADGIQRQPGTVEGDRLTIVRHLP